MTRTVRETDGRRNKILDTAETLITERGYSKTTIVDILNQVGIAKGTFYYYFKSKEEVMDAIIERFIKWDVQKAQLIAMDKSILSVWKMYWIIAAGQPRTDGPKDRVTEEFRLPTNTLMHRESIMRSILALSSTLSEIVSQRVKERLFSIEHPLGATQILLVSGQILFDSSMFTWTLHEMRQKINGFIKAMEAVLGVEKGTSEPVKQILVVGSGCILQESGSRRDE